MKYLLLCLFFVPTLVSAATPEELKLFARHVAVAQKINPVKFINTMRCESNFNQSARGLAGEIGVAQYLPNSFQKHKDLMGYGSLSIYSGFDQLALAALVWKEHPARMREWTCAWKYI